MAQAKGLRLISRLIATNPALNVSAVLLSHAHMDHCVNIGMLREDIPVVASPESIVIMKGLQDSGVSSLETDTAWIGYTMPSRDLFYPTQTIRDSSISNHYSAQCIYKQNKETPTN